MRVPRLFLSTGLFVLFSLLPFAAQAQRSLVIDAYRYTSDDCGTGLFRTLSAAMSCAQPGDTVRYHCDPNYAAECVEPPLTLTKPNIMLWTTTRVSRPVVFRPPSNYGSPVVVIERSATGSVFYGFSVDGKGYERRNEAVFPWTLVHVRADNAEVSHTTIRDGRGTSCLRVDDDDRAVQNVRIANNLIVDCIRWSEPRGRDTHCVHSCNASGLTVYYNNMARCSGDGVQLENYLAEGCENGPGWANARIEGNTVRTGPDSRLPIDSETGLHWTPGENGIDVKRTRNTGLVIRNNHISGHRGWGLVGGVAKGLGTGGGTSKGEGIVVQGRMEACTFGPAPCADIFENNIADTNVGISLYSVDPEATPGFTVRAYNNVIQNLSARTWDGEAVAKGAGIRAGNLMSSVIMHNTLVNLPGLPIYQEAAFRDANIPGSTSEVHSNLISNAGVGCTLKNGDAVYSNNHCFNGPNPVSGKNLCQTPWSGAAGFQDDSSQWYPTSCGVDPAVKPSFIITRDYNLTCASPVLDALPATSTVYQNACQGRASNPARMDPGAREYCGAVCP